MKGKIESSTARSPNSRSKSLLAEPQFLRPRKNLHNGLFVLQRLCSGKFRCQPRAPIFRHLFKFLLERSLRRKHLCLRRLLSPRLCLRRQKHRPMPNLMSLLRRKRFPRQLSQLRHPPRPSRLHRRFRDFHHKSQLHTFRQPCRTAKEKCHQRSRQESPRPYRCPLSRLRRREIPHRSPRCSSA